MLSQRKSLVCSDPSKSLYLFFGLKEMNTVTGPQKKSQNGSRSICKRHIELPPGRFQTLFEWLVAFIYDYVAEILQSRSLARKFFPLLVTLFLFIFTANLLEFTPGIGSLGFFREHEFLPLFRSVNTDLNVTLA